MMIQIRHPCGEEGSERWELHTLRAQGLLCLLGSFKQLTRGWWQVWPTVWHRWLRVLSLCRIKIEEEYAKNLAKLSQNSLAAQEEG
jgi:hypothetical protein